MKHNTIIVMDCKNSGLLLSNMNIPAVVLNLMASIKTRARLGRVAALGQPRSVYKSNIEWHLLSPGDGQITFKVKVNDIFNTSWENPKIHIWCYLVILAQIQIIPRTTKILKFFVKKVTMTLTVKINDRHF